MAHRFNVERISSRGTALYLAYSYDLGEMWWSTEADDAAEYDDEEDAQADADKHGGDVFAFQRPFSRRDVPNQFAIAAE
jgi:hypothetical protein